MMLLWVIRFFVFNLYESPKFLMGRGRDEQAVEVVHKVAVYNGKMSNLTLEDLLRAGKLADAAVDHDDVQMDTSVLAAVRRKMRMFSSNHVQSLFATRKMAWSTTLLIVLWGKVDISCWSGVDFVFFSLHRPCISVVGPSIVVAALT